MLHDRGTRSDVSAGGQVAELPSTRGSVGTVAQAGEARPPAAMSLVSGGNAPAARRASPSEIVYGGLGGEGHGAATPGKQAGPADAGAAGHGGMVVEDDAVAQPHQMKKTAFLEEVQAAAGSGKKGAQPGGPMFEQWRSVAAPQLESKIHQMVPGSAQAKTAKELVAPVAQQLSRGEGGAGGLAGNTGERGGSDLGSPEEVRAALGGGEPLDSGTRDRMEHAFDHDFGAVRIHAGDKGATMAGELGARAFAFGNDIGFGGNQYQPGTPVGDALLAHELAHVVQQQGQFAGPLRKSIGGESTPLEHDADHAAIAAVQNIHGGARAKATPMLRSGLGIQRCPPSGPTPAPPAVTIGTTDISGHSAAWTPNGRFSWWINWTTSGRSGWIVQKITNTYSGTDGAGGAINNAAAGATPSYYEAWEVDAAGGITGSNGGTGNRDKWERKDFGASSKGNWSMQGDVFWTAVDPARSGMASGTIGNAGSLLSSVSAPASLSGVLKTRTANGTWDSTVAPPTHTGTAG